MSQGLLSSFVTPFIMKLRHAVSLFHKNISARGVSMELFKQTDKPPVGCDTSRVGVAAYTGGFPTPPHPTHHTPISSLNVINMISCLESLLHVD